MRLPGTGGQAGSSRRVGGGGCPPTHPRLSSTYPSTLQGMADTFLLLGLPFDSPEAAELNKAIFETIYFAALRTSMQLAKTEGGWLGLVC